ncbi:ATPase [Kineococcus sp. R8]|nr:ABC-ATPase domain-containing protein [Kineococcus siccus]NAZ82433.1 ATPase [Kineococcus siccus]
MRAALADLHGGSYARYRSLRGRWALGAGATLVVTRTQPDPFAPPSRCEVHLDAAAAGFPPGLRATATRARALASVLARAAAAVPASPFRVDAGGPEVLQRSSCEVGPAGDVVLRFAYPLPGPRRRVDGRTATHELTTLLPDLVHRCLRAAAHDAEELRAVVDAVDDASWLRAALPRLGLVAFVADGAVLARRSGADDRPAEDAVAFRSPPSLRTTVDLPHRGPTTGAGIGEGVTVVVGGAFAGKSTLLRALEAGVADHLPGDGRELVVTRPDAVAVRAEDGRAVTRVGIDAFVGELPGGLRAADFSTPDASGSTSQAAAVLEALEVGCGLLLVDEDTSATNHLVRDARMQALVAREPLTPLVDRVRALHAALGVSTVIAVGASGDFLDVADRVLLMDAFVGTDVTARAREVARTPTGRVPEAGGRIVVRARVPDPGSVRVTARGRVRAGARGTDTLLLGEEEVDVRAVRQFTDPAQVAGAAHALARLVVAGHLDGRRTLAQALDLLDAEPAGPAGPLPGWLAGLDADVAVPRRHEVAAALDRLRTLRVLSVG